MTLLAQLNPTRAEHREKLIATTPMQSSRLSGKDVDYGISKFYEQNLCPCFSFSTSPLNYCCVYSRGVINRGKATPIVRSPVAWVSAYMAFNFGLGKILQRVKRRGERKGKGKGKTLAGKRKAKGEMVLASYFRERVPIWIYHEASRRHGVR